LLLVLSCFTAAGPILGCSASSSTSWSSSSGSGTSYGDGGTSDSGYGNTESCAPSTLPGQTSYAVKGDAVADTKAADFDGDGHVDLVVADASGYRTYLNDASGVLAPLERVDVGNMEVAQITLGDLDADGHVDIVLVGKTFLGLGLGAGDGTFGEVTWTRTTSTPTFAVTTDLDGDPRADLVVRIDTKLVAYENVEGKLTEAHSTYVGTGAVVVVDFDEDKHADAAVLDSAGHVILYRGDGVGAFVRMGSLTPHGTASYLFAHDLDGDGHLDLVLGQYRQLVTVLGHGDLSFGEELYSQTSDIDRAIVFADVDGDGNDDAVGASLAGKIVVLLGNGLGTVQSPRSYSVGTSSYGTDVLTAADLDEDGKSDIVIDLAGAVSILPHACR
jgi:hypothetical protein